MNSKELVKNTLARNPVDRIPVYDSFWSEVKADFRNQGVQENQTMEEYFDLDIDMFWFEQSFLLPEKTIEAKDGLRTYSDSWGTVNQEIIGQQTTPGLLNFAVQSRTEWEDDYKTRIKYSPDRINWADLKHRYDRIRSREKYIVLSMLDPFEAAWHMVGPEEQLMLMVMDPDFLTDIYAANTQLIEDGWVDLIKNGIEPDGLWLYGDIAYKNGLLFSPKHYQELLMPFHARLVNLAHESGAEVIYHSDGNLSAAIPYLIEIGVDCLHPLEVKAGMDIRELTVLYGDQICMMGNIDARLYQENDREGLENEILTKLPDAMKTGGYIYHSDHSIPPGTKLDTYQFGLDLVRKIGRY